MTTENIDLETLITLVQQRSSIYNYKDKQHSNRDVQEKLWTEISRILKAPVLECKTKWTTLRNSFSRQLREEKKFTSGSGATKKRKWYLYDNMAFLKDYMLQHKTMTSNLTADDLDETTYTNVEESEVPNVEEDPDVTLQLNPGVNVDEEIDSEQSSSAHEFKKPKKIKKVLASEMIAEPMISYLKSKTTPKVNPIEDPPELLFLKSLVPDIKKLNNKNQRRFKNTVLNTLDQLLDEQETSSSATSIYTSNFSPLYSNNVQPNQQHTIQPQPLNQNTPQTTQFLFPESPELLSSSESSNSYQGLI
ncbi:unnamed protein product [Macrosiphum euphorbiae]|uniref:MADF domain-containing protein n=1 Tax=Macrosiphum euphorbiae TaxID=13131 RepID=A0AAV0W8S5_9HEMI|nr:unnamed protein product [Macrosiphum euphorbiae]